MPAPQVASWLNSACDIATVIIAVVNVILLLYTFCKTNRKDEANLEKGWRIGQLKALVLDYTMKYLYAFFDDVANATNDLRLKESPIEIKNRIEDTIQDLSRTLRLRFTDALSAIDEGLYRAILQITDNLQENLYRTAFDESGDLSNPEVFDGLVTIRISQARTEMLRLLFSYRGE